MEIRDMISHAKDRLMDDLRDLLKEHTEHYSKIPDADRRTLETMCRLLALPDDAEETLAALSISYWNGRRDTLWERADMPGPGEFVGFCRDQGCSTEDSA